ncbi:MAG: NUDIX hydrolase [Gammaproteobacteria bacterium]|nr:NUDIX hydrolase [Gammaproteobacteria bacterium]
MQWTPFVTVAAVAQRGDQFLVVEEHANGGVVYNQPAGHLERDETLVEAVRREVLEETGWDFEPQAVIGVYLFTSPQPDVSYLRVCFAGHCLQHHPERPLDTGIVSAPWMSRDQLAAAESRLRSPLVLRCIDDYLAGRNYPLSMLTHLPISRFT